MTNFRIVNVQRDIGNSFIIRLEHWQQNYIKAEPVPVDLQKIFPEIQLLTFAEYYLSKFFVLRRAALNDVRGARPSDLNFFSGGDYPIDAFVRMNWNSTKIDDQLFPSDDKCQLEPFCVSMSPSDLKTFRITWKAK